MSYELPVQERLIAKMDSLEHYIRKLVEAIERLEAKLE
jgi:hypothetical protein